MDVKLKDYLLTKGDLIKLLEPLPDDAVMRAFCNGCSGYITSLTYNVRLDGELMRSITLLVSKKRLAMNNYKNDTYTFVRCSMDKLAAALRLALGTFADFGWFAPRRQVQRLPQRRTIGKAHRGYAKSRIRIHQRRG